MKTKYKKLQRFDDDRPLFASIPPRAMVEIAEVLLHGAKLYGDYNWCSGTGWSKLLSAAMGHLIAWNSGESTDADSGRSHLAHAASNILFLLEYELRGIGCDDRIGEVLTQVSYQRPLMERISPEIDREDGLTDEQVKIYKDGSR
jgi:hypothetical protein